MTFIQSILEYGDSIIKVCSGYIVSIIIFSLYNRRLRKIAKVDAGGKRIAMWEKLFWRFSTIFPVAYTAGIRGYITGSDTKNIWHEYVWLENMSATEALNSDLEPFLFSLIKYVIFKLTSGNVQAFLFLWAFFSLYFVVLAIERWEIKHGGFSLFIFYSCFGLQLFGQMRQLMSVTLIFYACFFAFHGDLKKFFLVALISGFIHPSAWISAVVIWYLVIFRDNHHVIFSFNRHKSENVGYYFLIGIVCVMLPYVIIFVVNTFLAGTEYIYLIDEMGAGDIGLGFILTLLPTFFPVLFFRKKTKVHNKFFNTLLMVVPCRLAGYYSYFLYRMFYYFGVINVVAFPKIVEHQEIKHKRLVSCCIVVCCLTYFFVYYCWLSASVYFPYVTFREIDFKW